MGKTSELRAEIKRTFVPFAVQRGFVLDQNNAPTFLEFRREAQGTSQYFDIQWEKYGLPRFVVNFGTKERGRLQPRTGALTSSWFRQDRPFLQRIFSANKLYPASQIVSELVKLFPELEEYWVSGKVGPHLRILSNEV